MAAVELAGVRKSYRTSGGTVEAVRGVAVTIAPGETVGLLGPNGAGKSTTIDVLLGLARPDGGTASLFGTPPTDAVAAGKGGAVLQGGGLLRGLSVRELVATFASLYPRPLPVDEVLAAVGIDDVAERRTQK